MSALLVSRPRLLQITSVALKGHVNIQPFASRAKDERSVLPTDPGVKPFSAIPGPPSLPILGNILDYVTGVYELEKPYETYSGFFKSYGPLVKEHLFGKTVLVHVFQPMDFRKVYKTEKSEGGYPIRYSHKAIKKHREARKDLYAHIGVAPSNGADWQEYRLKFGRYTSAFDSHARTEDFETIADNLIEYMKSNIDYKGEMTLLPSLYYYTLECK